MEWELNNIYISNGEQVFSLHSGLYTFNITTGENPNIEFQGKLISDIPPEQYNRLGNYCSFQGQYTHNDRVVI